MDVGWVHVAAGDHAQNLDPSLGESMEHMSKIEKKKQSKYPSSQIQVWHCFLKSLLWFPIFLFFRLLLGGSVFDLVLKKLGSSFSHAGYPWLSHETMVKPWNIMEPWKVGYPMVSRSQATRCQPMRKRPWGDRATHGATHGATHRRPSEFSPCLGLSCFWAYPQDGNREKMKKGSKRGELSHDKNGILYFQTPKSSGLRWIALNSCPIGTSINLEHILGMWSSYTSRGTSLKI